MLPVFFPYLVNPSLFIGSLFDLGLIEQRLHNSQQVQKHHRILAEIQLLVIEVQNLNRQRKFERNVSSKQWHMPLKTVSVSAPGSSSTFDPSSDSV